MNQSERELFDSKNQDQKIKDIRDILSNFNTHGNPMTKYKQFHQQIKYIMNTNVIHLE